jgi:AraC family transcriptional activator of pobA
MVAPPAGSRRPDPPIGPTGSVVIGSIMETAFVRRTWSFANQNPRSRGHAFFVTRGRASFVGRDGGQIELKSPFVLWLPSSTHGQFRLEAGGEGITLSVLDDFLWLTVGGSGLSIHLRPLLERIASAAADRIAAHLNELGASFSALARESCDQQSGAAVMMGLHLGVILVGLWRASGFEGLNNPRGAGAGTAQRFRQLVELHYREGLGVDEFARRRDAAWAHPRAARRRSVPAAGGDRIIGRANWLQLGLSRSGLFQPVLQATAGSRARRLPEGGCR